MLGNSGESMWFICAIYIFGDIRRRTQLPPTPSFCLLETPRWVRPLMMMRCTAREWSREDELRASPNEPQKKRLWNSVNGEAHDGRPRRREPKVTGRVLSSSLVEFYAKTVFQLHECLFRNQFFFLFCLFNFFINWNPSGWIFLKEKKTQLSTQGKNARGQRLAATWRGRVVMKLKKISEITASPGISTGGEMEIRYYPGWKRLGLIFIVSPANSPL